MPKRRRPHPPARAHPPRVAAPPTALGPHLAGAFREVFTQRVEGWRVRALILVLAVGVFGGAEIARRAHVGGFAEVGVQLGLMALVAALVATLVGVMRWRNAQHAARR